MRVTVNDEPKETAARTLAELLAGRLDFAALLVANGTPMFRAGTLRLIGVFAEQRHPEYPNVPTFREQGIDAVQMSCIAPGFNHPAGGAVEFAVGDDRQAGIGRDEAARLRQR